ncbi:stalk domain-containing protein [Paenibacillus sepulcri]|uniref:Copper amine oxidase N-terminal domain-containing protein n=1 Tax=Paenibacillus sepulcri TaxID=359917 RepID=A0ABS7CD04_9BACL|nr:copper amine oxidase N-terminal domain-containing protein [Paenibacillus sepulcri]
MKKKRWLALALSSMLLLPASVHAGAPANYRLGWSGGGLESGGSAMIKNGVTYLDAMGIGGSAGLTVQADASGSRIQFDGWDKHFAIRIGSRTGMLDGKLTDLGAVVIKQGEHVYVPARFLVHALEGGTVSWDAKNNLIMANGLHFFKQYSQTFEGSTYSVNVENGELFVTKGTGEPRRLASLGPYADLLSMQFAKTKGGLLVLTVNNNYGEPHINHQTLTLVLKNGSLIRVSDVKYWKRWEQNVTQYGDQLLLTDGRTLRLIQDGTGAVTQTIDLVKLGGEDDSYFIEAFDKDFLLIRPNQKGLLTLIDRATGASTLLYKKLLTAEEQDYAENNDVPYYGDQLKYMKREDSTLYFVNNADDPSKPEYTYTLRGA